MYSAHNSNTFLAYFNKIDRFFTDLLWLKKYVPYHERITMIVSWSTPVRRFVHQEEAKFRYFGDVRNQLVHWFRLENKHYLYVSDHAIEQITAMYQQLTRPITSWELVADISCHIADINDSVYHHIIHMRAGKYNYLPICNDQEIVWVLSFQDILNRLVEHRQLDATDITFWELNSSRDIEYGLFDASRSVFELQDLFEQCDIEVALITSEHTRSWLMWCVTLRDVFAAKTNNV